MRSRHRALQDQNISRKDGAIHGNAVSSGGRPPEDGQEAKAAVPKVRRPANGTITEWNSDHLKKLADELDAAIEKSAAGDAEIKAVHQLRTGSRRVQATVESMLRTAGAAARLIEKPAKVWLRSIKNIRRAAGPVRDLDVHRKLLENAIEHWEKTDCQADWAESFGGATHLASQARKLDEWLKSRRHAGAATLKKKIKKNSAKLTQRRSAFQMALQEIPPVPLAFRRSPGQIALDDFVRIVDRMPSLDAANLHEFRKQIKKARYVAETAEESSSRIIAEALKRVQDAIGDWHDLACLVVEGETALGKNEDGLLAWLERKADDSLTAALRTAGDVRGQLLGEWMSAKRERSAKRALRKKTPGRESGKASQAPREISGAA